MDLTRNELHILDNLPVIISINKDKFKYSEEYINWCKPLDPAAIFEKVELVRNTQQITISSIAQMGPVYTNISNQLSKTFMTKFLTDILNAVVGNVEYSDNTYCIAALKYVIEDALYDIKQNIKYITDDPGHPFIICSHDTFMKIKIYQEINNQDIIKIDEWCTPKYDYPIEYAGMFGTDVLVYEVHESLYTDSNGQGKTFGNDIIVGYSGTNKSIGPRLCFKSLYDVRETPVASLNDVCGARSVISANSEYAIPSIGGNAVKELYRTFKIHE